MKTLGHCQLSLRYTKRLKCDQPLTHWTHALRASRTLLWTCSLLYMCWKSNDIFLCTVSQINFAINYYNILYINKLYDHDLIIVHVYI